MVSQKLKLKFKRPYHYILSFLFIYVILELVQAKSRFSNKWQPNDSDRTVTENK